jgi:hypothetical protein
VRRSLGANNGRWTNRCAATSRAPTTIGVLVQSEAERVNPAYIPTMPIEPASP